jgi:hypothetical protein
VILPFVRFSLPFIVCLSRMHCVPTHCHISRSSTLYSIYLSFHWYIFTSLPSADIHIRAPTYINPHYHLVSPQAFKPFSRAITEVSLVILWSSLWLYFSYVTQITADRGEYKIAAYVFAILQNILNSYIRFRKPCHGVFFFFFFLAVSVACGNWLATRLGHMWRRPFWQQNASGLMLQS